MKANRIESLAKPGRCRIQRPSGYHGVENLLTVFSTGRRRSRSCRQTTNVRRNLSAWKQGALEACVAGLCKQMRLPQKSEETAKRAEPLICRPK